MLLLNRYWTSNMTFVPFNLDMSCNSRFTMNREQCNCETIRYCFKILTSTSAMKYFRTHNLHLTLWKSILANQSCFHLEHPDRIFSAAVLEINPVFNQGWKEKTSFRFYFYERVRQKINKQSTSLKITYQL